MASVSLVFTVLVAYICFADGVRVCLTPSKENGRCKPLEKCPSMLELSRKTNKTREEVDLLKKSDCSLPKEKSMICCPNPCYTPEGKPGECISIFSCPHLAALLAPATVTPVNRQYVSNAKCLGKDQYSVCCGPPPDENRMSRMTSACSKTVTAFPPAISSECCGQDAEIGNRITGGTSTAVDQYPWLVVIEYVKLGEIKLYCGGGLISGRYVLTAGHCVAGEILEHGTPKYVRLGEYNTVNEGKDCIAVEGYGEDCTDGMIVIPIEKTIPHPDYIATKKQTPNDIALIRLAQNAPFTEFIRPICLPSTDVTTNPPPDFFLYAAGWGAISIHGPPSAVKLHVDLPYSAKNECETAYQRIRNLRLTRGQMCAGGVPGKDSCKGDSGGPLMFENGRTFEMIGIVSFGPEDCGSPNIPGVYTKVFEYKDWIMKTIVA